MTKAGFARTVEATNDCNVSASSVVMAVRALTRSYVSIDRLSDTLTLIVVGTIKTVMNFFSSVSQRTLYK